MGNRIITYQLYYGEVDEEGKLIEGSLKDLPSCENIKEIINSSEILTRKIKSLEEELDKVQKENGRLNQELLKEWKESYENVNKYEDKMADLYYQIGNLEKENKELKSDREKLQNRIIEIIGEYDEEVTAYEADVEELYLRIDSLDKENKELKKEIEVLKADNKDLEDCHESHCKLIGKWDDRCKELEKEVEVLKAGNEELAKKLINTEHMRDQYRILYNKYQTSFSVTEEMALDLNKLLDDAYDLVDNTNCFHTCYARRIKECIEPQSDIIKAWITTMDRERTYYDKQLEVAYRKSRESK